MESKAIQLDTRMSRRVGSDIVGGEAGMPLRIKRHWL